MLDGEITIKDELVQVDDQHVVKYKYKEMTFIYNDCNGKKSFVFPLRYDNHKQVNISEEEGRILYSILQTIYGEEDK